MRLAGRRDSLPPESKYPVAPCSERFGNFSAVAIRRHLHETMVKQRHHATFVLLWMRGDAAHVPDLGHRPDGLWAPREVVIRRAMLAVKTASVAMFSNTEPPPKLTDLVPRIEQPIFFIHASDGGETMNFWLAA